ncbi:MAG: AccI family restriction endonuclease [bacterium]
MYKDDILNLIEQSPLEIDTKIQMSGGPPTMASSEFLTNKEQGNWAEKIVFKAINEYSNDYFAVEYGRSKSIAAGDDGSADFYIEYQGELNAIGKRPDILIFRVNDFPDRTIDVENDEHIRRAVVALEVRSSSFLANKYATFMRERQQQVIQKCTEIRNTIIGTNLGDLLRRKNEIIYNLISNATDDTFRELDCRCPSWSLTKELRDLTTLLKDIKENIKILHKQDYLSITPKMEDIALVNRWIQQYNVKHFYLQVFFDKAYIISFKDILTLISNDNNDGNNFSIERDVKNQEKTTIKQNFPLKII